MAVDDDYPNADYYPDEPVAQSSEGVGDIRQLQEVTATTTATTPEYPDYSSWNGTLYDKDDDDGKHSSNSNIAVIFINSLLLQFAKSFKSFNHKMIQCSRCMAKNRWGKRSMAWRVPSPGISSGRVWEELLWSKRDSCFAPSYCCPLFPQWHARKRSSRNWRPRPHKLQRE